MFRNFSKIVLTFSISLIFTTAILAGPGDTIKVQTFTFGSPQDAWFDMPSLDVNVEKVLMKYTLKCVPGGAGGLAYDCGEWDYLTYTNLFEHTGNLDSTLLTHPFFEANGASPDTFSYSSTQTFINDTHWEYFISYDDTVSLISTEVGTNTSSIFYPFYTAYPLSRTQIIWRASELTAAGMVAGNITGLDFNLQSIGDEMKNLTIKMKTTALDEFISPTPETGFTTVYQQTKTFTTGWDGVDFITPFYWDGISNIAIEITYDNNSTTGFSYLTSAGDAGFQSVLTTSSAEKYLQFYEPDHADVIGNPLADLSDQITVAFWAYGDPAFQPQNGTTFEAITSGGTRVLNSHTPWSDANVYWDAGNSGGYDRIYKNSAPADYEGNWVYWTFTKNTATGSMKIYKNGVLWHSGTGMTKLMTGIDNLRLGKGNWGGSETYDGNMDEFAIWNVELDAATISDYMFKDLDASHPYASNLKLYYHFNEGNGITEPDDVDGNDLGLVGAVAKYYKADELRRNLNTSSVRPLIRFEQGEFASHTDSILIVDAVPTDPITLIHYDPADPTVATDTILVWPGDYYNYTYNPDGTISDSFYVSNTNTIYNSDLAYYSAPFEVINRYELARYITPYGIGLDLGDGFTWTYDVSDYRPILHDSVHIAAGNWQEHLDLEFLFIEGTPPRDVKSVTNLWQGGFTYGLTPSYDDQTPAKEITMPADAVNSRIKVRVSGHGFGGTSNCSEFCSREHYFKVNGETVWTQEVWRDNCDLNPVYPQGGTWVYDRSNWCPGAEVWTYDYELTPEVSPGNTYTFDYSAEDYTWNGAGSVPYYQTEVQMVTYGAPNFNLDAAVDEVISPSSNQMYGRKNPICTNPVIKIKNTGATTLTSLKINYGIKDYDHAEYTWTGELKFMESEEIKLPQFPWSYTGNKFEVTVSEPNGGEDEYSFNNTQTTDMIQPDLFPAQIILDMKTNSKPNENDLFLYNEHGDEIFSRTSFDANTIYKDTLTLVDGCYELFIYDYGEDGLSWWANADGTGYFRIRDIDGNYIKQFNADFGGLINCQFTIGNYTDIKHDPINISDMNVYPNPTKSDIFIDISLAHIADVHVDLIDVTGKVIHTESYDRIQNKILHIDMTDYASGYYFVRMNAGNDVITRQFVLEK